MTQQEIERLRQVLGEALSYRAGVITYDGVDKLIDHHSAMATAAGDAVHP
jgi:hypothetical protein